MTPLPRKMGNHSLNSTTTQYLILMHINATEEPNVDDDRVPKLSISQLAKAYPEYRVGDVLYSYVLPLFVVVGLAGNTLSFLVMLQPANRRISCCVYMVALAVTDNFTLLSVGFLQAARFVPRPVLTTNVCRVAVMWGQSFIFCGVIFVVCMTVDRWLAVQFPLKAVCWCSTKRAKITAVLVVIFGVLYNVPYYIYTGSSNGRQCVALARKNGFTRIYTWISIVLNSVVPFTMLIVFNILIICTIKTRRRFFDQTNQKGSGKHTSSNPPSTSQTKESAIRERQIMFMLILVSFTLLVLTLPQYIRYIIFALIDIDLDTPQAYARYLLTIQFTSTVFFSNNCFNFALYCLGGSKFRQDLMKLIPCINKGDARQRETQIVSLSSPG